MSKRTERREAEHSARKLASRNRGLINSPEPPACGIAHQQFHQSAPANSPVNSEEAQTAERLAAIERVLPGYTAGYSEELARLDAERDQVLAALNRLTTPEPSTQTQPSPEEIARMEAVVARVNLLNQLNAETKAETNRANAQRSTGPTTPEGKAAVSQNRRSHGLTGSFQLLPTEDMLAFKVLTESVYAEYQPETGTEQRLADSLIRHYWLMQRALNLQDDLVLNAADSSEIDAKRLALFMRYQTTHERSYYKAQKELQNLHKQKQKEQLGFESQNRRNEALEAKTRLDHARALVLEVDANCRQVMEAPMPGTHNIPFADIAKACGEAISVLAMRARQETAGHQNAGSKTAAQ